MSGVVKMGDMAQCSFGAAPSPIIPKQIKLLTEGTPAITVMDFSVAAIPTFGVCQSMANPTVAAATAAALGVLTPMPCIPMIVAPWAPGHKKLKINGIAALTKLDMATCAYGGNIKVSVATGKKLI